MKNIVPVGLEFQVNFGETPGGNNVTGDQYQPVVTALPNGNFVVIYQNPFNGNFADLDVMWQEFKADGTPLSGPYRLAGEGGGEVLGDVVARSNNGFAAVWRDSTNGEIELALVDPGASSQPTEFVVADVAAALDLPSIATLANGSHFVAYESRINGINDIYFTIVNAHGDREDRGQLRARGGREQQGRADAVRRRLRQQRHCRLL